MAVSKHGKPSETLQSDIIKVLTPKKQMTVPDLAKSINRNYYTVRDAVKRLEESGVVIFAGFKRNAHAYRLSTPGEAIAQASIPMMMGDAGKPAKISLILDSVGKEDSMLARSVAVSLPRNLTRLFKIAIRAVDEADTYDPQPMLQAIRVEMEANLKLLTRLVDIHKTILNSDNLWDPYRIKTIPYDVDFDKDKVLEAYRYYYPEE